MRWHIRQAGAWIKNGGVVAYPTEAVYGLGCDPLDLAAIHRIFDIKRRPIDKGLILLADRFERVEAYIEPLGDNELKRLSSTWPGPVTWILPAQRWVPEWLTGGRGSLAVRVTAHPVAAELCRAADMPIVSTSANISGRRPARTAVQVHRQFADQLDFIVAGRVGPLVRPTEIRDLKTGNILRAG